MINLPIRSDNHYLATNRCKNQCKNHQLNDRKARGRGREDGGGEKTSGVWSI